MTTDPNQIPHDPQEPINPDAYRPYGEPPGPPARPHHRPHRQEPMDRMARPHRLAAPNAYAAPTGAPVPAGIGAIWQKWLNVTSTRRRLVRPGATHGELARDFRLSLIGLGILSAITGAIAALYTGQTITIPRGAGTTTTVHIPV